MDYSQSDYDRLGGGSRSEEVLPHVAQANALETVLRELGFQARVL